MKRRNFIKTSFILPLALYACKQGQHTEHYLTDSTGKEISLEGTIIHVCPIEKIKMKLRLDDGEIICVLPADNTPFDKNKWDKKRVRISGLLQEERLTRKTILSNFEEKKLLCHIDHTPCIDSKWIENHWKRGTAEELLKEDNETLQRRMSQNKANFIQVFSIVTQNIAEI